MNECAVRLVGRLGSVGECEEFNITEYIMRCTLEMVCATTIGADINNHSGAEKLSQYMVKFCELITRRIMSPHLYWEVLYNLTPTSKQEESLRREAYKVGQRILDDAIALKVENSSESREEDYYRKPKIFMDQLLESIDGRTFERDEILHNIYTMIAAGTDTSGTELIYICQMLAMHPDMQERVYQEMVRVFPEDDAPPTAETLKQLEYMEMFIKESLRLFPIAPHIMREAYADFELDGMTIPKGTAFIISIYNLHRRKDIWGPDADSFNPENFSKEQCAHRSPFAFIPFSAGSRNCIGHRYAMNSMKIVVAHILRSFRITTRMSMDDIKFKMDILLKSTNELLISLARR
ncbi:cytochrome P450 4c21-like isoform X2 [Toxorhynchites rutilus septentrionalis]|nr:cytochrome P450 4c21-like isoform X2 [Toxorhynchites rutilus septentrionalis]